MKRLIAIFVIAVIASLSTIYVSALTQAEKELLTAVADNLNSDMPEIISHSNGLLTDGKCYTMGSDIVLDFNFKPGLIDFSTLEDRQKQAIQQILSKSFIESFYSSEDSQLAINVFKSTGSLFVVNLYDGLGNMIQEIIDLAKL